MSLEHSPVRQGGRAAFTITEFCDSYRLSRSMLYKLWQAGSGPRFMKIGTKTIITFQAADDWASAREHDIEAV